jgi:uncharacterized protein YceK
MERMIGILMSSIVVSVILIMFFGMQGCSSIMGDNTARTRMECEMAFRSGVPDDKAWQRLVECTHLPEYGFKVEGE